MEDIRSHQSVDCSVLFAQSCIDKVRAVWRTSGHINLLTVLSFDCTVLYRQGQGCIEDVRSHQSVDCSVFCLHSLVETRSGLYGGHQVTSIC